MGEKRVVNVFIGSPNDLAGERRAFKDVIDFLNSGFGDGAGVEFVPLAWEDTLSSYGRRPQSVINQDIDRCHVFMLALHRRWGQPAPDAEPYSSYTEEEFHRAVDRFDKTGAPEIFVFFKYVDPGQMADAGPQLAKVLAFRRHLEESRKIICRHFQDEDGFKAEIETHLRAYVKGDLAKPDAAAGAIILPLQYKEAVEIERQEKERLATDLEAANQKREAAARRAETLALSLAEEAAASALEGLLEPARQKFAQATDGTTSVQVLSLAYEFYIRIGETAAAEMTVKRWLDISGPTSRTSDTATAYDNLGVIYRQRGELDQAEEMHRKALAIDESLGREEGIAKEYANLGAIYLTSGNLADAEGFHRKALAIFAKLGSEEGVAKEYGNLGIIFRRRGELNQAEELLHKALAIFERLGQQEGIARAYSSLGNLYGDRGESDKAEDMHRKALAIEEALGRQEGMAVQYFNLGYSYIGRREVNQAEEMFRKALTANELIGRREGIARNLTLLGLIHRAYGELDEARDLLTKARDLYFNVGLPKRIEHTQRLIDELEE